MRERVRTPGSRANEKPLQVPHLSHPGWGLTRSALWTSVGGRLFSLPALRPTIFPPLLGETLHPSPKVESAGWRLLGESNRPALPCPAHTTP